MSDTTVNVNLRFNGGGTAPGMLRDMQQQAEQMRRATQLAPAGAMPWAPGRATQLAPSGLAGGATAGAPGGFKDAATRARDFMNEQLELSKMEGELHKAGWDKSAYIDPRSVGAPDRKGGEGAAGELSTFAKALANGSLALQRFATGLRDAATGSGPFDGIGEGAKKKNGGGDSGGMGMGSFFGPAMMAFAKFKVAEHLAVGGMNTVTNLENVRQNSSMSEFQKDRAQGEALPILGTLIKSFYEMQDAINGTTEALRKGEIELQRHAEIIAIEFRARSQIIAVRQPETAAFSQALADKDAPFKMRQGPADLADPRQRERFERNLPADRALLEASRGVAAQTHVRNITNDRIGVLDNEEKDKQARADRATAEVKRNQAIGGRGIDNQKGLEAATREQKKAIDEVNRVREEKLAAVQQRMQAAVGIAEQQKAAGMALIQQDQVRLGLLKEQEQRLQSQAQQIGMMDAGGKALAESAFDRLRDDGWDNLVAEEKQRVAALAPEFAQKQAVREGEGDDLAKKVQDITGEKANLAAVRKQVVDLQTKIEVTTNFDEEGFRRAVAQAMEGQTAKMERIIRDIMNAEKERVDLNHIRRNAFPGR